MLNGKLTELELQLESEQERFSKDRDDAEEQRLIKERSYENQLEDLRNQLNAAEKGLEVRDRQLSKNERRVEEEHST